ncbi:Beta-1,4-galactosyltransferase 6,Beta-1,4-galactosyltransferase 5 [Mytilus coruscus]|uniref:Beta-1,4-galactosyltransferase n=1 Tax=Mytilus coruscus TaxID=42192 RepID=A0A6J8B063_MYTCO|nr:Beta-1,4-galactosyltransferase 6,Beta-1,4-galactosyltransferase 5 [Mytilus coruscus]
MLNGIFAKKLAIPRDMLTKKAVKQSAENHTGARQMSFMSFSLDQKDIIAKQNCPWPPHNMIGREPLNRTIYDLKTLTTVFGYMKKGHFKPKNCSSYQKIAVVVPFRDREPQLRIFLNNFIPRIYRQQLEFTIYVVEQTPGNLFNKGMLINTGFIEAMKDMKYDCIVIHDVDILAEDDRILYTCGDNPAQLSTKIQKYGYSIPFERNFGGIVIFSTEQFKAINGYPNQFFGWGREDHEVSNRIRRVHYNLSRPFHQYGHCGSVQHQKATKGTDRLEMLRISESIWKKDGLFDLFDHAYTILEKQRKPLYVWIYRDIDMKKVRQKLVSYINKGGKVHK